MFFTRTHTTLFPLPKDELIDRLIGKHVSIHNIDFEIFEEDGFLKVIPHAEQVEEIKTLPIAKLDLIAEGKNTKVVATFKMRRLDAGGPFLIVIFCAFLFITSITLMFVDRGQELISYSMFGAGSLILAMFSYRLQTGYFDYIRKIRAYIKGRVTQQVVSPSHAQAVMA